jgi:hypothetical protein
MKRLLAAVVLVAASLAACAPGGTPSASPALPVTPAPTARAADTPPIGPSQSVAPVPTSLPTQPPPTQSRPKPSIEIPPPIDY